MAFEYFISKKTLKSVVQGKKVSKPIVRISIISIALSIIVNLVTIAVVTGFQHEVRQKVSGFGSPIFIMSASEDKIHESEPIRKDQPVLDTIKMDPGVKSIFPVGYKPVLFQSKKTEITYTLPNGKDTSEIQQNVFGTVLKGVGSDYDWTFFKENIIAGEIPVFGNSLSEEILISKKLANNLHFSVGDEVSAFFVRNQPVKRKFTITGIYESGLDEFDKKIVMADLRYVQRLNDWGIRASIEVEDTLYNEHLVISANISGGNGHYRFDWGKGYSSHMQIALYPIKDTVIRLIASDHWGDLNAPADETTLPDTAYLKITIDGTAFSACDFRMNELDELDKTYLNETGSEFSLQASQKTVNFELVEGAGSSHNYTGGFEVSLNNWEDLDSVLARTKKKTNFIATPYNEVLKTTSIKENQRDIFVWLGFLDINVIIILTLMILIGIINMGSALLVLILIRSNFIGMMKAMGATNWSIRKIFLIQAGFLIGRGLLWGNIIGLGICFVQNKFGVMALDPKVYYLTQVPIELNVSHWFLLNIGTLVVCLLALVIPSIVITRISPVKAIKFN
ncbi:MAG: ABC transporter permease [Crocinitomicaceae bacterium]|nr:ABC transporter permease [Crocinitomicaceae bacterium]